MFLLDDSGGYFVNRIIATEFLKFNCEFPTKIKTISWTCDVMVTGIHFHPNKSCLACALEVFIQEIQHDLN